MNRSDSSTKNICYLCLGSEGDMYWIHDESLQLIDKIQSIAPVQISSSEELPVTVCVACTEKVDAFYAFQQQILRNNEILKQSFKESTLKVCNDLPSAKGSDTITKCTNINLVPTTQTHSTTDEHSSLLEATDEHLKDLELCTKLCQQTERAPRIVQTILSGMQENTSLELTAKYVCLICLQQLISGEKVNLMLHAKSHFKDVGLIQNEPPFNCEMCFETFGDRESFVKHQRAHFKLKPFKCKYCGKQFGTFDLLEKHATKRIDCSREKFLSCEYCGSLFKSGQDLADHKSTHLRAKKPLNCELCQKRLSNIRTYRAHMNYHLRGRQYICEICSKSYFTLSQLKLHKTSHEFTKSHLCSFCGKGFRSDRELNRHIAYHYGTKTNKCKFCDLTFYEKLHLSNHVKAKHVNCKAFACEICGKLFATYNGLKKHIKNHPAVPSVIEVSQAEYADETDADETGLVFNDDTQDNITFRSRISSVDKTLDNDVLPQSDEVDEGTGLIIITEQDQFEAIDVVPNILPEEDVTMYVLAGDTVSFDLPQSEVEL